MNARDHAAKWLEISSDDLESAGILMKAIPPRLEIICVLCQQSAEKAMKSLLADLDHKIPKIHNLLEIQELLKDLVPALDLSSDDVRRLNSYDAKFRYPNFPDLSESQARAALSAAERVLAAVKGYLAVK
jgi:HEPN domain-containing protein